MAQSRRYPVHDGLRDACKFAATVSRFTFRGLDREFLPPASNDTATISFIEFNGTYYALTARHVINGFRESAKKKMERSTKDSCVFSLQVSEYLDPS